mmetsp:Transcript_13075/g.30657  ORF Transcript_13075/g.30657 Transcript_13075/m.30657 type:complete len:218 (-) Transcript_13075:345-998(-)
MGVVVTRGVVVVLVVSRVVVVVLLSAVVVVTVVGGLVEVRLLVVVVAVLVVEVAMVVVGVEVVVIVVTVLLVVVCVVLLEVVLGVKVVKEELDVLVVEETEVTVVLLTVAVQVVEVVVVPTRTQPSTVEAPAKRKNPPKRPSALPPTESVMSMDVTFREYSRLTLFDFCSSESVSGPSGSSLRSPASSDSKVVQKSRGRSGRTRTAGLTCGLAESER